MPSDSDEVTELLTVARSLFGLLEQITGPERARKEWAAIVKSKPGPKGARSQENDKLLLSIYDRARNRLQKELPTKAPRLLSEFLYGQDRQRFGISANAIEKRLRRLLNKRRTHFQSPGFQAAFTKIAEEYRRKATARPASDDAHSSQAARDRISTGK